MIIYFCVLQTKVYVCTINTFMTPLAGLISQYKTGRGYDFTPTAETLTRLGVISGGKPSMRLWRKIERGEVDPPNGVALAIVQWLGYTPGDLTKSFSINSLSADRQVIELAGMQQVQP